MKILSVALVAGLLAGMMMLPAHSQETKVTSHLRADSDLLDSFDIIIGDTGQRFNGWSDRETRVFAEVYDGRRYHEHYFDNLPAMMFVLREKYLQAQITYIEVPEYAGYRHENHGHEGHGLIDGRYAWYVWDHDRYSRGGTPLVLAFDSLPDARREARYRDGSVLSYEDMIWRLYDWSDRAHDRVYWRGWDNDRWSDDGRWQRAYDRHWHDARWDDRDGWLSVELKLGNFNLRYDDDNVFDQGGRYRNYSDQPQRYFNRAVDSFEFGVDDGDGRRWTSATGGDHDRGHGNDPDGIDEDNPGNNKGAKGNDRKPKKNPAKDKKKDKDKDDKPGKGKDR